MAMRLGMGWQGMAETSGLKTALKRLDAALSAVETAVGNLRESDRNSASRDGEAVLLAEDRARLAQELDATNAHAASLENANREVGRRLDVAIDGIKSLLTAYDH